MGEVWTNIDHPLLAHETTCEHCNAARELLRTLQEITAQSRAAEQRAHADMHPSPGMRASVLAIARAGIRRARPVPVATTELETALISEQTLLVLVRAASDTVSGVRARCVSTTGLVGAEGAPIGPGQETRQVWITAPGSCGPRGGHPRRHCPRPPEDPCCYGPAP